MTEQVPLDRLVLNLLALVEAAPYLPPENLDQLAGLVDDVEPAVDALAYVGLQIQTELLGVPAFDEAKAGWDALLPDRHALHVDALQETLPDNPGEKPATGVERLADVTRQVLQDPQAASEQTDLLQRLASLVKQRWPRQ